MSQIVSLVDLAHDLTTWFLRPVSYVKEAVYELPWRFGLRRGPLRMRGGELGRRGTPRAVVPRQLVASENGTGDVPHVAFAGKSARRPNRDYPLQRPPQQPAK